MRPLATCSRAEVACDWLREAGFELISPWSRRLAGVVTGALWIRHAIPTWCLFAAPFSAASLNSSSCALRGLHAVSALDLSMLLPLETWNPFDYLIERDSYRAAHPDIAFAARAARVPVVGICRVEPTIQLR